jgi:hypothetical protein
MGLDLCPSVSFTCRRELCNQKLTSGGFASHHTTITIFDQAIAPDLFNETSPWRQFACSNLGEEGGAPYIDSLYLFYFVIKATNASIYSENCGGAATRVQALEKN